jgi:uncharacterized protein (TIGR00369 family)
MDEQTQDFFAQLNAQRRGRGGKLPPPIAATMGFELSDLGPGRAVLEMTVDERHHNPMGTVHGGTLSDLADAAMGLAHATQLDADASQTTVELKINFLRPLRKARIRAVATVKRAGRTIGLTQCDILDEQDRLVAHAVATQLVLRGEQAAGR